MPSAQLRLDRRLIHAPLVFRLNRFDTLNLAVDRFAHEPAARYLQMYWQSGDIFDDPSDEAEHVRLLEKLLSIHSIVLSRVVMRMKF